MPDGVQLHGPGGRRPIEDGPSASGIFALVCDKFDFPTIAPATSVAPIGHPKAFTGIEQMHFNKGLHARVHMQDNGPCAQMFARLLSQISELPEDQRGAEALKLSASLLEFAAFELAGRLDSEEISAMIHCAVGLTERSAGLSVGAENTTRVMTPVLQ